MKKSDFLDELRLEIGLAYDYAHDRDDFMVRVLKTIHAYARRKAVLTVHTNRSGGYRLTYALGMKGLSRKEEIFGTGFLTDKLQAITYVRKGRDQVLFLPIYECGKVVYLLSIRLIDSDYLFSKQDMIFAEELAHFIETKRSAF